MNSASFGLSSTSGNRQTVALSIGRRHFQFRPEFSQRSMIVPLTFLTQRLYRIDDKMLGKGHVKEKNLQCHRCRRHAATEAGTSAGWKARAVRLCGGLRFGVPPSDQPQRDAFSLLS